MTVKLYGFTVSPPTRSCMMTCEALGVDYTLKVVEAARMEHMKPEYLKLNPVHSIPTLEDGDYVLFDSHAISCYLANMYGKEDKWYPKDPKQRGVVDQRLHFNNSVVFPAFKEVGVPLLMGRKPHPKSIEKVKEAVHNLDLLLGDSEFIALRWPTIADCHASSAVLAIDVIMPGLLSARMQAWMRRCEKALPGWEKVHGPAIKLMKAISMDSAKL